MQYAPILPTLLTVVALAYMGFLVVRSRQDAINKVFLSFITVDAIWLVTVFMVNFTVWGAGTGLSRFVFAIVIPLLMLSQAFITALFHFKLSRIYRMAMYGVGTILALLTLFTNGIITGVGTKQEASGSGILTPLNPFPEYGSFYGVYILYFILSLSVYFFMLIRRTAAIRKGDPIVRKQISTVARGLGIFALITLLTNLVLPTIFSSSWPSQFAPVGSLVLAFSFFYAMSKYRLFDVKVTAVRSTTYAFLLVFLAIAYAIGANIASSITTSVGSQVSEDILNTILVLAIALSFHPLKVAFDKITNRFFFRDRYDTQDVIDNLNRILISNTDITDMLRLCEALLVTKLKLEFVTFGLFVSAQTPRVIGSMKDDISVTDYINTGKSVFRVAEKVVVKNDPVVRGAVRKLFDKKNVGAVGKMTLHDDGIGFIVFGDKKNNKPFSRQDVGLLGIASDQIAIATQNVLRFEEIARFNITLQEKVDEKTHKLQLTNDKLRRLDQTKDDFISMASHQLRTPLTSIKGYISMVLEGDAGEVSPLQKKLLAQAFVSSQRMVYLISDLLNVSRLRTGKFVIETSPTHLASIAREEVNQLQETAKSRGIKLTINHTDHFPALMLDETKMRQVIMNFIDNAIYYSPQGGHIAVNVVEKPQSIELTVVDEGMGVPKSDQPHLFTKFFRAHNARRARPDGTGLGLFMAKKVVVAQGGAIIFRSQEGKGSTFGFTFAKDNVTVVPHYKPSKKEPATLLHKPKSAIMS